MFNPLGSEFKRLPNVAQEWLFKLMFVAEVCAYLVVLANTLRTTFLIGEVKSGQDRQFYSCSLEIICHKLKDRTSRSRSVSFLQTSWKKNSKESWFQKLFPSANVVEIGNTLQKNIVIHQMRQRKVIHQISWRALNEICAVIVRHSLSVMLADTAAYLLS